VSRIKRVRKKRGKHHLKKRKSHKPWSGVKNRPSILSRNMEELAWERGWSPLSDTADN